MMYTTLLSLFAALFMAPSASAQSDANTSSHAQKIKFVSYVQFVSGDAHRMDNSGKSLPLAYGDALYEGDRIELAAGAFVKLRSSNECVLVVYGPGTASAPQREKPWHIDSGAVRSICSTTDSLAVEYNGKPVDLSGGEILLTKDEVIVYKGKPQIEGTPSSQVSKDDLLKLQHEFPVPAEGTSLAEPAKVEAPKPPPPPKRNRVLLGPSGGSVEMMMTNSHLKQGSLDTNGARVTYMHQKGNGGWLLMVAPFDEVNNNKYDQNNGGMRGIGTVSSHIKDMLSVSGGWRFNWNRWWSPFVRAGVVHLTHQVDAVEDNGTMNGAYYAFKTKFIGASAATGVDAYWRPFSWLGIYGLGELNFMKTLARTGTQNMCNQCAGAQKQPAWINEGFALFGLQISAGLVFQF